MLQILKKTCPYYGKIYGVLILCTLFGQVQGLLMLVEPQIISLIVDCVINPALGKAPETNSSIFSFIIAGCDQSDWWGMLWRLILFLGGTMLLYFITFYTRWNLAHYFSIGCDNRLRGEVLKKIHSFGPSLMKEYSSGDLITIVNSDSQRIRDFHVATIPFMVDSIVYIGVALYFLSRISLLLMLIPFITVGIFVVITKGMMKLFDTLYDGIWRKNSELNTETQESIYGIRTIKSYGREDVRKRRFYERSEDVRDYSTTFGIKRARYMLAFDGADQIVMLLSMIVSIYLASKFEMTSGEYSSFLIYLLGIIGSFVDLIFYATDIQGEKVSVRRMFGFLDKENPVLDSYGTKKVSGEPHIRLEHVTVYENDKREKKLVDDVSLDIPYGKKVGIMGKIGSGKSVLLKTIQAFWEYEDGEIEINGIPFHEYDRGEITRIYGYAMQDVFLFSHSIAANIAYYRPEADEKEIEKFAEIACVDEFASQFPDRYETIIGEKGFGLSGGQKQRVAIARALLKDAPVTVLDDCTSALDMDTESKIFANLENHFKEKTLIMATHRARALKDFDEILFMDNGKIIERGTFDELMEKEGAYAGIYRQQMDKEVYVSE